MDLFVIICWVDDSVIFFVGDIVVRMVVEVFIVLEGVSYFLFKFVFGYSVDDECLGIFCLLGSRGFYRYYWCLLYFWVF